MKKLFALVSCFIVMTAPMSAKADIWGGDVAVLIKILAQAIMQYVKLKEILGTASNQLDLLKEINKGINDSLNLMKTVDPSIDPGIYSDWETNPEALGKLQSIYGQVPSSPETKVQRDTDQGIAEAVAFNNNYYKWTKRLDEVGENIKNQSHRVSPGGAQKLSAQALGLMIQVMNQSIRAQATTLKLQAQEMAIQNSKDKAETKHLLDYGYSLKSAMKAEKIQFQVPRF